MSIQPSESFALFPTLPCTVNKGAPDWSHIFLDVLSPLPLQSPKDEATVAAALRSAAGALASRHGARLRRAAVAQWDVKLRVADKSGAWRVVVSAPTGKCIRILLFLFLFFTSSSAFSLQSWLPFQKYNDFLFGLLIESLPNTPE
jgi:hypothetical protein